MALSDAQKTRLFQILKVPLFDTVGLLHGEGNLNQQPFESGSSEFQAKAAIEAHLADLAANYSGLETELKSLLDRYDSLGSQSWVMDAGAIGATSGVTLSPASERQEIRDQVIVIVPYYMAHESIQRTGYAPTQVGLDR